MRCHLKAVDAFEKEQMNTETSLQAKANIFKENGNKLVQSGNFVAAIDMYDQAISIYEKDAVYFTSNSKKKLLPNLIYF